MTAKMKYYLTLGLASVLLTSSLATAKGAPPRVVQMRFTPVDRIQIEGNAIKFRPDARPGDFDAFMKRAGGKPSEMLSETRTYMAAERVTDKILGAADSIEATGYKPGDQKVGNLELPDYLREVNREVIDLLEGDSSKPAAERIQEAFNKLNEAQQELRKYASKKKNSEGLKFVYDDGKGGSTDRFSIDATDPKLVNAANEAAQGQHNEARAAAERAQTGAVARAATANELAAENKPVIDAARGDTSELKGFLSHLDHVVQQNPGKSARRKQMISDIKSLLDHLNEESGLASKFKKDPKTKQQGDDIDSTVRAAREIIKNMLALDSSSEDFRILNEFFTNANLNNKNPKSIAAILGFARLAKAANFVTNHAFGLERPNPTDAVAYNKWLTKIGEKLGIPKTGDLETWKIAVETAFRRWVSDRVMDYASSETLRKSVDKMMADTAAKKTLTGDELAKEWLKDTSKSVADLKAGSKLHEALTKLTDREKLIMGAICNGKSPCTHWKDGCERYRKAGRRST